MAYTTINKPSDYFNTKLYTGNGSTQSITGVGFQPDFTWIKDRTTANSHYSANSIMGANISLPTNGTNTEITNNAFGYMTSFDSDGFSLTNGASGSQTVNFSGDNYVSWNWLASNTTASNTDGTISSTVSALTTSGFSIVSYTGNSTSGATVGHGLGAIPKWIIVKARNTTDNWEVYHASLGAEKYIELNLTAAQGVSTAIWNDTEPTSSVFSIGNNSGVNTNGNPYIAYCFAEKKGFSRFGSYTGNGNADGAFVYTGFKPAWLMVKRSSAAGDNWIMWDNKRDEFNVTERKLEANDSGAEAINASSNKVDFLSNGFKMRTLSAGNNASGSTYIYMAFAENPFTSSTGTPVTAR